MAAKKSNFKLFLKILVIAVLLYFITYASIFIYSLKEHLPSKAKDLQRTAEVLHFESLDGEYVQRVETHKGFFSNGYYFAEIQLSEENDLTPQLIHSGENWKKLPVPENLRKEIVERNRYGIEEYKLADEVIFPFFDNGYYLLTVAGHKAVKKSIEQTYNLKNYEGIQNYTLALYNSDTRVLYVFDFDDNN